MAVTAKVFCSSKSIYATKSAGATFRFTVNYADGQNKAWAQATPTLSLEMAVNDESMFEVGESYTLTFERDVPSSE